MTCCALAFSVQRFIMLSQQSMCLHAVKWFVERSCVRLRWGGGLTNTALLIMHAATLRLLYVGALGLHCVLCELCIT